MKHRVKKHHWHQGVLRSTEYFFENLLEALTFAKDSGEHTVKVYNEQEELVHHIEQSTVVMSSYA
jgi:hypothetical protein